MKAVCKALRKEVLTEFLSDRYVTLTDVLERCLKKGELHATLKSVTSRSVTNPPTVLFDCGNGIHKRRV